MIMHAGEILQRRGLLTSQQLEQSRNGDPQSVVDNAVTLGYVSARDALSAIADEVGLEFRDLRTSEIDLSALEGFPQKLIYRHSMFPIGWDDGALLVATADPFDLYPLDEACATTGKTVVPVVAG
ncbi:MAG: type II/IV secretion system protein, partial [Rhodopirellula bahusiensis]